MSDNASTEQMMTGLRPGDIVEIRTGGGLAYVQVTHDHPSYPDVVRAIRGLHRERPSDVEAIAAADTLFSAILPLDSMVQRGALDGERIGCAAIPEDSRAFPTFKTAIRDKAGEIAYWWYWDGDGLSCEAQPRDMTERMPTREVLTAKAFLDRLSQA